jgi:Zn-dependent protease
LSYILCPNCKFLTPSGYVLCKHCAQPLASKVAPATLLTLTVHGPCIFSDPLAAESVGGQTAPSFVIVKGETHIGRMMDNDVVLFDEEVSRHHAVITRDPSGSYLVEDLQSTNGTFLNGTCLKKPSPVKAGDELKIWKTTLHFGETSTPPEKQSGALPLNPAPTLVRPGGESSTGSFGALTATLWSAQAHSENFCPRGREGWALKQLADEKSGDYFILKSLHRPVYIRLNERDVFLWKLMDGRHTLRDLLVAYMQNYHSLGADRLLDLLDELTEKGFLQNAILPRPREPRGGFARNLEFARKILGGFFQKQYPLKGVDEIITRAYTRFAWRFFTLPGQIALAAIALAGTAAFAVILQRGNQSLFQVQGSIVLGLIVLGLANAVSIFLHEMGHAMTLKAYHREVRRVGVMIYYGMPTFFVDTSDIWMEPKGPRIQTSLAGPYVSFLVGSLTSLVMAVSPAPLINSILFKLAAWSYIDAFFNLNPLLELDGYFILIDWMEMPLLRKRSLEFLRGQMGKKIWRREAFSREERLFALFGILSALWSGIAIGIFLFFEAPPLLAVFHGDLSGLASIIPVVLLVAVLGLIALLAKREKRRKE